MKRIELRLAIMVLVTIALSACWAGAQSAQVKIDGFRDPFLAGQKDGVQHGLDRAPQQSPVLVNLPIASISRIQFVNVTGTAARDPNWPRVGPEGEGAIASVKAALGISGHRNPYMSLVGVFLPGAVNQQAPPPNLDFDTPQKRDFAELRPLLYQSFFIGDGLRNDKRTVQAFVVPSGATRLFLGVVDGGDCYNNIGAFFCEVRGTTHLQATGSTRLGSTVTLDLVATGDAGLVYQLGTSLTKGAIPIDRRTLGLSLDALLAVSVNNQWPTIFRRYTGVLSASGTANAAIGLPNFPKLVGIDLHTAFITLDARAPSGVKSISNTHSFKITS